MAAKSADSACHSNRSPLSLIDAAIRSSLAIIANDRLGELRFLSIRLTTWQQRPTSVPASQETPTNLQVELTNHVAGGDASTSNRQQKVKQRQNENPTGSGFAARLDINVQQKLCENSTTASAHGFEPSPRGDSHPVFRTTILETYKQNFIDFMVDANVLTFGDLTTKSGRKTPFFINTGRYKTGSQMNQLAGFYADAIQARQLNFDFLFGPAYKGIPLVVAISMELSRRNADVPFCFNRKEAKDHGEGGTLVGHAPAAGQRVLIVEDVTTAGTSIRETVPQLNNAANIELAGLVVSVDRMERGQGTLNALSELRDEFQMDTFAIVTICEIAEYLRGRERCGKVVLTEELYQQIQAYRQQYGGKE